MSKEWLENLTQAIIMQCIIILPLPTIIESLVVVVLCLVRNLHPNIFDFNPFFAACSYKLEWLFLGFMSCSCIGFLCDKYEMTYPYCTWDSGDHAAVEN
jgi:hypothetical protein